jgi:hypothetical protein
MHLTQSGSGVTGNYSYDKGKITGSLSGFTLTGKWSEAPTYSAPRDAGDIVFTLSSSCGRFDGKWRYGSNGTWKEDWWGDLNITRQAHLSISKMFPEPLPDSGNSVSPFGLDKKLPGSEVRLAFDMDETTIKAFEKLCEEFGGIYYTRGRLGRRCLFCETYEVRTEAGCVHLNDINKSLGEQFGLAPGPLSTLAGSEVGTLKDIEGEVFILRSGPDQKWKLARNYMTLFQGDRLVTKTPGWVQIDMGANRLQLVPRTSLIVPTPDTRTTLERGAMRFWENIKRLARNEPFEVEGGHSIAGVKGTDFIMEVHEETQLATYTVNEGSVDVWLKDDSSTKREVGAGESVQATEKGIEDNPYEWDALIEKYGLENLDLSEPIEVETSDPIDVDEAVDESIEEPIPELISEPEEPEKKSIIRRIIDFLFGWLR